MTVKVIFLYNLVFAECDSKHISKSLICTIIVTKVNFFKERKYCTFADGQLQQIGTANQVYGNSEN